MTYFDLIFVECRTMTYFDLIFVECRTYLVKASVLASVSCTSNRFILWIIFIFKNFRHIKLNFQVKIVFTMCILDFRDCFLTLMYLARMSKLLKCFFVKWMVSRGAWNLWVFVAFIFRPASASHHWMIAPPSTLPICFSYRLLSSFLEL